MRYLLPLTLFACAAPDGTGFFNKVDVRIAEDEIAAALEFIPVIEAAQDTLHVALPRATYTPLTDAIIAAHDRNVDVKVVTDIDRRDHQGILDLEAARVPLTYNDNEVPCESIGSDGPPPCSGPLTYFDFSFNQDVSWSSEQILMSHAFVVADRAQLAVASQVGGESITPQVVVQMTGEEIGEDLITEHNQLFGGSDATALTAFSAPAKSLADVRDLYRTDSDAPIEVYFGPQERLTKRIIDAIYTARTSVKVLSNEIVNSGLNQALQEKASWGFDIEAIAGPDLQTGGLSRDFRNDTDDVVKLQISDAPDVPTVILIDIEGGENALPRAFVLSHDLYSAARFFGRTEVITDQLIDGTLVVLQDKDYVEGQDAESSLQPIVDLYLDHQMRAGAL